MQIGPINLLDVLIGSGVYGHRRRRQRVTDGELGPVGNRGRFPRIEHNCIGIVVVLNRKAKIRGRVIDPLLHDGNPGGIQRDGQFSLRRSGQRA